MSIQDIEIQGTIISEKTSVENLREKNEKENTLENQEIPKIEIIEVEESAVLEENSKVTSQEETEKISENQNRVENPVSKVNDNIEPEVIEEIKHSSKSSAEDIDPPNKENVPLAPSSDAIARSIEIENSSEDEFEVQAPPTSTSIPTAMVELNHAISRELTRKLRHGLRLKHSILVFELGPARQNF